MAINGSARFLKDGCLSLEAGVDGGRSPSTIGRNQVAGAVNTSFRGGFASPRPGLKLRPLTFPATGSVATAFKSGRFQHASFYDGIGIPMLLSSHGGRQFKVDCRNFRVSEITPPGPPNSDRLREGWSVQAENYWIYQDNQSFPVIFDGSSSRRSNPMRSEVPVGNVMAYTMGRLIVALRDRQSFRAGDLLFGPSGDPALGYRDSVLRFTENNFLNEGGDFVARVFGAPSGYGPILAMKAISMENTQLGQGPLMVFLPNLVFTIQLPFDRTTWKNLSSPLQTVSPVEGALSQETVVSVNSDLWYRSLSGIRSFIQAVRQFQEYGNTPLSSEVGPSLAYDNASLLPFAKGVLFDNRLLQTVGPVPSNHGIWHRGLVALDFNLISGLRIQSSPAWEGVWSGLRILSIVKASIDYQDRCFLYALNDNDEIELWELVSEARFDNDNQPIHWSLDFPAYNCGDGFQFKRLELGELFIDQLAGQLNGTVKYKPDQHPCFLPWDTFSVCAKDRDCGPFENCTAPQEYRDQFRSKIRFHQPPDNFDDLNRRRHRTGYEFQPRLELEGYCQIKQLRVLALPEDEVFQSERTQP